MTEPTAGGRRRNVSPSAAPVPKVAAAGAAGAAATVLVLLVQAWTGSSLPPGVEGAIATLLAFAAGYLTPPRG